MLPVPNEFLYLHNWFIRFDFVDARNYVRAYVVFTKSFCADQDAEKTIFVFALLAHGWRGTFEL